MVGEKGVHLVSEQTKVAVKRVTIGNRDPNIWHWASVSKQWIRKSDLYDNRKKPQR